MKFLLKISTKITLWYTLASGLIIIIMAIAMYYIYDIERRISIDEDLQDYSNFLTTGLTTQKGDLSEVYDKLFEKKSYINLRHRLHRFALVSNDSIIFESGLNIDLDSIIWDMEDKGDFFWKSTYNTITSNNLDYRTYSVPLASKIKREYRLIVFSSFERLYESLSQLRYIIVIVTPIAMLIAALIGFIISRKSFERVRLITETASNISYNNLGARVEVGNSQDELALLASTFNSMIERLEKTFIVQKRFIADASHDFRTPITIIQVELEMLLNKYNLSNEVKETIEKCLKETDSMTNLAENLLLLARFDSNQLTINKESVRIDEVLLDCVSQLNNLAKIHSVTFIIDIDDAVTIDADINLIRRMFINIIDNAIKYSFSNEKINISLANENDFCKILIKNKGNVIKEEMLQKVFNRFQRIEESRTSDGFGLGLSISKAIVETHNGNISISSDEINGTCVEIRFKMIS